MLKNRRDVPKNSWSSAAAWFLCFVLIGCLAVRTVFVHVFPHEEIKKQSQSQYWSQVRVAASRGDIRDRNGQALALSVPSISFFIDPMYWSSENADVLEPFFGADIANKFRKELPGRFHWVMRKVPQDIAKQVIEQKIPGLFTIRESHRMYPHSELASHVIGFCDVDDYGLSGIEREWNKALFSPPQNRFFVRDARGNLLDMLGSNAGAPDTGVGSVKLTLDSKIQQIVEWKLKDGAEEYKAKWGAGICVNPQTGEIYAMASYPPIDLNDRGSFKNAEKLRNNVTSMVYEPGSTFKPIILGIAKEMGVVSDNFHFKCTKRIRVADGVIGDVAAHGDVTLEGLLIKSCNTGMASIGNNQKMTPYATWGMLKQFGFGVKSGVELSGEEEGLLRNPEEWHGVTKANVAIGQGLAVTPLQLAMGISAIANGGELLKPYIVAEVKNSKGEIIHEGRRRVRNSVMNARTSEWLRRALYKTVEEGTGKAARIGGIPVAGKTGTAQLAASGAYAKGRYVSSFVGFWPYEKPEYLLFIVLGEPDPGGKYYGGEIAAPVFRAVVNDMVQLSLLASSAVPAE
jgi:cell division protein FtsI (penicillin-binding protein 3)/stage V sporulation protein D (sporulation-specific penicillin-binding protein)